MDNVAASGISRRRFLHASAAGVGALALPSLLAACGDSGGSSGAGGSGGSGGQVVWADYGGTTRAARQAAFFDGFTAKTGTKVVIADANPALVEKMATGGAATWDALPISEYDLIRYIADKTITKLSAGTKLNDTLAPELQPYSFMTFYYSYVQGWLPDTFPNGGPQSWADWFDVKKFPGKRAFPGVDAGCDATAEIALLADGVSPDKLYPLDLKRAYAKLDTIRDHITFYEAFPQVQTLLSQKAVAIGFGPSGLFNGLRLKGVPNEVQWNQGVLVGNVSVIPLKAPNVQNAMALADYTANDLKGQAEFARRTGYGPANSGALDLLTKDELAKLANSPANKAIAVRADPEALAKLSTEYTKEFNTWASKA